MQVFTHTAFTYRSYDTILMSNIGSKEEVGVEEKELPRYVVPSLLTAKT